MEKTHVFKIETYGTKFKMSLDVSWEVGIDLARQATEQVNGWTRHPTQSDPYQHMDKYFDIYNEGSISLLPK